MVCGNSDPGTSGILSPFGDIDGLYFNNSEEPEDFMYDFKQDLRTIMKQKDCDYVEIETETKEDYYKILDLLSEMNRDSITVYSESRNKQKIIIEQMEDLTVETNADKESAEKEAKLIGEGDTD